MIEIIDLKYQYPDGKKALEGVNLRVQPGERVALIGPNGAGKSTLLLHMNGILQGEGMVRVNNLEVNKKNLPHIRSLVGMVFQNPDDQLFSLTVGEDVAYGLQYKRENPDMIAQKTQSALKAVNLEGFENRHPFHLSSGEKKRASIASVLSMDPEYLVLDEPTANLDPRSRRELIALLHTLPHAQIIATHDLPLVQDLAHRVVLVNQGRVVADGSVNVLLADRELLQQNGLI